MYQQKAEALLAEGIQHIPQGTQAKNSGCAANCKLQAANAYAILGLVEVVKQLNEKLGVPASLAPEAKTKVTAKKSPKAKTK